MVCCSWRNGFEHAGQIIKEVNHVRRHRSRYSPPRLEPPPIDQLWNRLTSDQRRRTLTTLSSLVVRLLDAPRNEKGVHDEHA